MGNSESKAEDDKGIVTLRTGSEEIVEHPNIERLNALEVSEPLESPDVQLLRAEEIDRIVHAFKDIVKDKHLQIEQNQSILVGRILETEKKAQDVAQKGIDVLQRCRDAADIMMQIGKLNKEVEELCSSIERACVGTKALRGMLSGDALKDLPRVDEFVWQ